MAVSVGEFRIKPVRYEQAPLTIDDENIDVDMIQVPPPTPTKVILVELDSSQVNPASEYNLLHYQGWLYRAAIPEALVGSYYWYCLDENDNIIDDGYIYLLDTVGPYRSTSSLVDASLLIELENILAYVSRIGTGTALVNAPVSNSGIIPYIIIGDKYLDVNERAFTWTREPVPGMTTSSPVKFGGENVEDPTETWSVTGTITEVSGMWLFKFDLPASATEDLSPGKYKWSVEIDGVTIVLNHEDCNETTLVRKYT